MTRNTEVEGTVLMWVCLPVILWLLLYMSAESHYQSVPGINEGRKSKRVQWHKYNVKNERKNKRKEGHAANVAVVSVHLR